MREPSTFSKGAVLLAFWGMVSGIGCGSSTANSGGESHGDAAAPSGDSSTSPPDGGSGGTEAAPGHDSGSSSEGGDSATPSLPQASSWMGTNVDVDLPFADVTRLMSGFNTAASQLDDDGYPAAGASGTSSTDMGFLLPSGTYNISFVGTGSLSVSGIGATTGAWTTVAGEQRNQVKINGTPGSFGHSLTLQVTNTGSQTVTAIHMYLPGIDYDPTNPFNPQFLSTLGPFRAMRFMDWLATNDSKLANWSDRPTETHFGQSSYGQPYELVAALINETGKDGWINIPELATSDFINQFATFMAMNLDFDKIAAARKASGITSAFQLIVENSNENWNTGFSAYTTFLNAANAAGSKYSGTYSGTYGPSWMASDTNLMKVGQYEADRLVTIGNAFKTAFKAVGQDSAIAPVLAGWSLGAVYSDDGLQFIKANYGDPKNYVSYIALAPYFATPDDSTTGSLSTLFPALQTAITSMDSVFTDFANLGKADGIAIAAYEGGQGITGSTNQPIKHLAQFDERMYQTYTQYFTFWKSHFGNSLFMHFDLSGNPGQPENIYQYGFWGSLTGVEQDLSTCGHGFPTLTGTEAIASVSQYCPKYQALADRVPD